VFSAVVVLIVVVTLSLGAWDAASDWLALIANGGSRAGAWPASVWLARRAPALGRWVSYGVVAGAIVVLRDRAAVFTASPNGGRLFGPSRTRPGWASVTTPEWLGPDRRNGLPLLPENR